MYPIAQLLNAALETPTNTCRPPRTGKAVPRTNILESEQDYLIVADLPGVRNEDLDISLEDETLTIKAARNLDAPEGYTSRRAELAGKVNYERTFNLGTGVDVEQIGATLEDGILTVTIPKSEKIVPRRIEVK